MRLKEFIVEIITVGLIKFGVNDRGSNGRPLQAVDELR